MRIVTEFPRRVVMLEDVPIVMADGTRLSCRIWLPEDAEADPVPAIVEHLPYRKRDGTVARDHLTHPYFAGHGYACLRVDMRGNGDSEGLLLLTDDGKLQARIANPRFKMEKTYLVQVEGVPDEAALTALREGVTLKDGPTRPAGVRRIDPPEIWERDPPVRYRKSVPDCWREITISEGRNRQVRRMTAHVDHPTLRLIRWRIGDWTLDGIAPGTWQTCKPTRP